MNQQRCDCHSCTQSRRSQFDRIADSHKPSPFVFTAEDFQQIFTKIFKEGYKSWSAGDMWEPEFSAQDIANIANEKIKKT